MVVKFLKSAPGITLLSIFFVLLSSSYLFFYEDAGGFKENRLFLALVASGAAFGMLGLPLFFVKYVFKDKLADFGLRLPADKRKTLILTLSAVFISIPVIILFSGLDSFKIYYKASFGAFIFRGVVLSLIYYLSEEFLFRGFMFWGLWRKIKYHSFWLTSFIFAAFHLAKPPLEILFAFFLSLVLCFLSLKSRSFFPAAIVHFLIALMLNFLIVF